MPVNPPRPITFHEPAVPAASLPEQGKGIALPTPHQQTVSEAKGEWRNEGNPI